MKIIKKISLIIKRYKSLTFWRKSSRKLLKFNDINICFNRFIKRDYDPAKKNILIAIESPAVIRQRGWLRDDMKFYAEISFANFYKLKNYYCCRQLYVCNDNYVDLETAKTYQKKNRLVSLIYSNKTSLPGHKLRNEVAGRFKGRLDVYGSGTGRFLNEKKDSLEGYRFQIVIENDKCLEYVSEKLYDCFKTKTVPIYWGGELAVMKMGFNMDGIIFFDTLDDIEQLLDKQVTEENYQKILPAIECNLNRLIELRNEQKFHFYLNSILQGYFHSTKSYHKNDYAHMSFFLDRSE